MPLSVFSPSCERVYGMETGGRPPARGPGRGEGCWRALEGRPILCVYRPSSHGKLGELADKYSRGEVPSAGTSSSIGILMLSMGLVFRGKGWASRVPLLSVDHQEARGFRETVARWP